MSDETYYTVLGISENATQAEIKAAYRNLIKQVHPDTIATLSPYLRGIAEDKAKELTEAYSVLSDVTKRRQYDRLIAEHRQQSAPAPPPSPPKAAATPPPRSRTSPPAGPGPQAQASKRGSNWEPLKRWPGKHPELVVIVGLVTLMFVLVVLSDSNTPPSSRSNATVTNANAPAPAISYSAFPCDARYSVSPIDGKPCPKLLDSMAPTFEVVDAKPVVKPAAKPRPKPVIVYAIVTGTYGTLNKRCAFLPSDNYGRCGYKPETLAQLQRGDRLRVLSPPIRAENGEDIRKVRTEQGWEGWIDISSITLETDAYTETR